MEIGRFRGRGQLTIIDFFLHSSSPPSDIGPFIRERINSKFFDNLLSDTNLLEAICIHKYLEIPFFLTDLCYNIL